jgi:hypothetical protein
MSAGNEAMSGALPVALVDAIAAAHRGDLAVLHASLDWQLSEAPIPARSAGKGVPGLLVSGLDQGIAGIRRRHENWPDAAESLRPIAARLATATGARPATPGEAEPVLRAARVERLPEGVSDAQRAWFDEQRERAAQLRDVWLVQTAEGPLPVILVRYSDLLVLPLDADAYR